jgi:hypothetical protein
VAVVGWQWMWQGGSGWVAVVWVAVDGWQWLGGSGSGSGSGWVAVDLAVFNTVA